MKFKNIYYASYCKTDGLEFETGCHYIVANTLGEARKKAQKCEIDGWKLKKVTIFRETVIC